MLIDEKQAATEVTNLLINLGLCGIAHISGDMGHVATLLRYQGFEDAILRAKLNYNPQDLTREGQFSFKLALRCTEELLSLPEDQRPTAIFCANDEMAAAALMIANRMGYRVPEDLSIVGFDDSYISKVSWPQLTTVSQPFEDIAAEAVNQLGKYPEIGQFDPRGVVVLSAFYPTSYMCANQQRMRQFLGECHPLWPVNSRLVNLYPSVCFAPGVRT